MTAEIESQQSREISREDLHDGSVPVLTHATERDVDLLIVEELKCSPAFVAWFVARIESQIGRLLPYAASVVMHSHQRTLRRRQIDICLTLQPAAGLPSQIFIENKLDASDQPQQAEFYQLEATRLVRDAAVETAVPIVMCPKDYSAANAGFVQKFPASIFYEEIADFLGERVRSEVGELASRLRYREGLIRQAISKAKRGYEPILIPELGDFKKRYTELCRQAFPKLIPGASMLKEGSPHKSMAMIFSRTCLPDWPFLPQMRLVHSLRGDANICFYHWGAHYNLLKNLLLEDLKDTPFQAVVGNFRRGGQPPLMIAVPTPIVDPEQGFDSQRDKVFEGLRSTETLRAWLEEHGRAISKWADSIAAGATA